MKICSRVLIIGYNECISKELAHFADEFQEKIGYDIQLVTITRPSAYGEYEPYHFVNS